MAQVARVEQWPFGMWVGCKRDAIAAVEGRLKSVGEGFCRQVYANASGTVVYKVASGPGGGDGESNVGEYRTMVAVARSGYAPDGTLYRSLTTPVALYHMDDGTPVLAMVARPMDSWDATDAARKRFSNRFAALNADPQVRDEDGNRLHIGDMHAANYRASSRSRVQITDAGPVVRRANG